MITKILIIINLILPLIGCYFSAYALSISYMILRKIKLNEVRIQDMGLFYLLMEKLSRITIYLILIINLLLAIVSITRIMDNFAPYATDFYRAVAVIIHLAAMLLGLCKFLIYTKSDLSFIKRIKI